MIIKEVILNEVAYQVEISEIDQFHFWSQQIAVARAFAKAHNVCHYPLLQRLANPIPACKHNEADRTLLQIWSIAFK